MNTIEAIFGHHTFGVWLGTIIWTVIILLTYKLHQAPSPKQGFKWLYFWNDNSFDLILNLLLSMIVLRTGDGLINSLYNFLNEKLLVGFGLNLDADSMDIVMAVSIIVLPISYYLHKNRVPIKKDII